MLVREQLISALSDAAATLVAPGEVAPPILLTVLPEGEPGDFTTDLPLSLARQTRRDAAEIAEALQQAVSLPEGLVGRVEVTAPGFLTFHLREGWELDGVRAAREQGSNYGRAANANGEKVLLEFVSADPTGPLTVEHGRGAALGDALANLLEWNGCQVTREFYINDAGSQVLRFGRTLETRCLRELGQESGAASADGFSPDFVEGLSQRLAAEIGPSLLETPVGERQALLAARGVEAGLQLQRETLASFGVRFDEWRSEKALHDAGRLTATVAALKTSGATYDSDGALWLRTSERGDAEDRPLLRSNGSPTYLAADLAYHLEKLERGYERLIDIWGSEHAGYIQRTQAGLAALGKDPGVLEVLIFGEVSVRIDGMPLDSSGQKSNAVELEEVIRRCGAAGLRFHYLSRPVREPLELDLDIVRRAAAENPAWRVAEAARRAQEAAAAGTASEPETLPTPEARALARRITEFADELRAAGRERDPHRVALYAVELADAYRALEEGGPEQSALSQAVAVVLANVMTILGMAR